KIIMKHLYEYINEIMDIASVNHAEPQNAKDMFLANVRNAGLVLNICLGMAVWDYSTLPGNLWGQICLPFSALWALLAGFAVVLDDWLRYWMFGEDRPHYVLF
ncbi:putative ABC transporter permease, partial [Intestinimonas butyriciproducens]|uniref:putative ABC transporter permease n=1 Tax=Intestinimonas butyriciproducens TaxID=1297617 RepID=UPI003F618D2F